MTRRVNHADSGKTAWRERTGFSTNQSLRDFRPLHPNSAWLDVVRFARDEFQKAGIKLILVFSGDRGVLRVAFRVKLAPFLIGAVQKGVRRLRVVPPTVFLIRFGASWCRSSSGSISPGSM